jgi:hypothetical protein
MAAGASVKRPHHLHRLARMLDDPGVALARLVAQGRGMSELEQEVPASITLASPAVTTDNVAQYLPLGFES